MKKFNNSGKIKFWISTISFLSVIRKNMENIDPFEYRMPKEFSRGVESKVNLSEKKKEEEKPWNGNLYFERNLMYALWCNFYFEFKRRTWIESMTSVNLSLN